MTTKELHAKLSTKLRTRRKGILKLLAGVAFASLVVFAVYSAIAVLFAFLVYNPEMIRKVIPKGDTKRSSEECLRNEMESGKLFLRPENH